MNSISHDLRDRLEAAQKSLGLTGGQLAAALEITPEWLSKILRGHVKGSRDIALRLDDLLRRRGIELHSTAATESTSIAREDAAPYGTADSLRAEARRHFDELLAAANDDPVRLGWLLQQMREHLRRPSDWKVESAEERKRRLGLVRRQNPPGAEGQSLPTIPHGKSAQA